MNLSVTRQSLQAALQRHHAAEADGDSLRWAAVALIVRPDPASLLIIVRAERTGDPWSGHLALPGGGRDMNDSDLAATAIRETAEEVGLQLHRDDLLGTLDDVAPRGDVLPPIAVRPFVFWHDGSTALQLSHEVASAAWVTLDALRAKDAKTSYAYLSAGNERIFPAYATQGGVIWGMTERVLVRFLEVVTGEAGRAGETGETGRTGQ